MSTKHTQGPWHWDADLYAVVEGVQRWRYRVTALGRTIMQTYYTDKQRGQAEADTRLAAAAPDLLEALEAVVAWMDEPCTKDSVNPLDKASAAIRKATGETP